MKRLERRLIYQISPNFHTVVATSGISFERFLLLYSIFCSIDITGFEQTFYLILGSPKPKRGSASPLIECKSDSLGIPKPYLPPSRSHSVSPRTIPNGVFKPISSIDEFEAIENQRKESYNSTGSSHGEYDDVFEPISSNEDPDVLLPVS